MILAGIYDIWFANFIGLAWNYDIHIATDDFGLKFWYF